MRRQPGCTSFLTRRPLRKPAWLALLLMCGLLGVASRGRAVPVLVANFASSQISASRFVIADFDGDSLPDLATVEIGEISTSRARYWIGFQMSAGPQQMVGVTAPVGGLEIAIRDVNGDNRLDLIVTTKWSNRTVVILVNDGHGKFTVADPAAFSTIVSDVERNWAAPSFEVKSSAAAVIGRASGDCALDAAALDTPTPPELGATEVSFHRALRLTDSALGRAPPVVVYHV
ncbi:MAG: VCBS repeat-containing protein [Candidatus Acidiferrum sp.]